MTSNIRIHELQYQWMISKKLFPALNSLKLAVKAIIRPDEKICDVTIYNVYRAELFLSHTLKRLFPSRNILTIPTFTTALVGWREKSIEGLDIVFEAKLLFHQKHIVPPRGAIDAAV